MVSTLPKWSERWPWEKCEEWLDQNGFDQNEGAMAADFLLSYNDRAKYDNPADTWRKWVRVPRSGRTISRPSLR